MKITVHKFGGASMKDAESIKNVLEIIKNLHNKENKILIVISAFGKTTSALEKLVDFAIKNDLKKQEEQLLKIIGFHQEIINTLLPNNPTELTQKIDNYFTELKNIIIATNLLGDVPPRIYDRVMAFGELFSSNIITEILKQENLPVFWQDAREIIITDPTYKHAQVLYEITNEKILQTIPGILEKHDIVIIPGYIAGTLDNKTTTLGREGSDFTAALIANAMNAESLTLWKDVPGIFPKNPEKFHQQEPVEKLSYKELLKMSFYGAKVVHPKTIAPLQQKNIPLIIKSFKNPQLKGTFISDESLLSQDIETELKNKTIITLQKKDFDFISPKDLILLFNAMEAGNLPVYQTSVVANEIVIITENEQEALQNFQAEVQNEFKTLEIKNTNITFKTSQENNFLWMTNNQQIICGNVSE